MKRFHIKKGNYPVIFKYTKPDEYFDGFIEKQSWYFSICDWNGDEIDGFISEQRMLDRYFELEETRDYDLQVFVYPMVDDELDRYRPFPLDPRQYYSEKRENYVFDY